MDAESRGNFAAQGTSALRAGDFEAATISNRRLIPLHDRMGLTIVDVSDDSAVLTMELTDEVKGAVPGSVHGGMLATLADVASAIALTSSVDGETQIQVTTDMHLRYYRQPRGGPIRADARVVHRGRRLLSTECVLRDSENRELARATATYMLVARPF